MDQSRTDDLPADLKGTYEHVLDPKGRLTLPVPFRSSLMQGGSPTFLLALDKTSIVLMPPIVWRRFVGSLGGLKMTDEKASNVRRFILSHSFDCAMDDQGRALVPPKLRELASIGRDVTLLGSGDRVEIWDRARWNAYLNDGRDSFVRDARDLGL